MNRLSTTGIDALPIQGKRDAPRTFKGNYDKVEEFLKTMDKLFSRCSVTLDNEKVEAILPYCSTRVQEFIRTTPSFTTPNWANLKKHMMEYYDAERANRKYTPNDIWAFNKEWNLKSITDLTHWKKYYRDFYTKAGTLLARQEISDKDFRTFFWLGLPESIRLVFEPKIQAQIPNYDASTPYTIEQICSVAENYFKRNKFTEMVFNPLKYQLDEDSDSDSDNSSSDSDSDSDYDSKRRRKLKKKKKKTKHARKSVEKEKPTQKYQGPEQEIEGMIQQLNTMSLSDPKYGHLYFKVMKLDTSGLAQKCVYREPPHITQPRTKIPMVATSVSSPQRQNSPTTFPNNLPMRNRSMAGQTGPMRCFGCSGNDHMLGECPRMKELIKGGTVIFDAVTRKYYMPDGRNILRRMGESIADAAQRIQTMHFRPVGVPSSNLVTLGNEVQNYYQQVQYQEDSDEGYESEEDGGPYWKLSLQANQDYGNYEEEEYELDEEGGNYAEPVYPVYPVERSSTRIAEAREKASRMPGKTPPKEKFEGVFPPSRKMKPIQNYPSKQASPPPSAPVPQQLQPVQVKPKQASNLTRHPQPVDVQKP